MTFAPRFDILPPSQRALWPELASVPRSFVLYGGTALALRLGHRVSVDFDFFSSTALQHAEIDALPFVHDSTTVQQGPEERTVLVEREGSSVKVSFFGGLPFGRVGDPDRTHDDVLAVASLLDLAGTKIKALLQRVESKDYRDVAALLASGITLAQILAAGQTLFGTVFNPLIAQKALAYFQGGDLETLDAATRQVLEREAIADLELPMIALASRVLT